MAKKSAKKMTSKAAKKPAKKITPKKQAAAKKPAKKISKAPVKKSSAKAQPKAKIVVKKTATTKTSAKKLNLSGFISPLDDRVLVQIQAAERITAGGLIIPDTAQITGNQRGLVVAVGRGHRDVKGRLRPLELRIGDEILLPEHSGDSIQVDGQDVKILRESEILGIVD